MITSHTWSSTSWGVSAYIRQGRKPHWQQVRGEADLLVFPVQARPRVMRQALSCRCRRVGRGLLPHLVRDPRASQTLAIKRVTNHVLRRLTPQLERNRVRCTAITWAALALAGRGGKLFLQATVPGLIKITRLLIMRR